jgi:hypothetical protein
MPFLGTVGGSNEAKGQGGYHPGQSPIDTASSSAAGSLGTTTITSSSASTSVSGQRQAIDPFYQGAITYSLASGALPPGFSLNTSTGAVSGSYTVSGVNNDATVYSFTIRATTAGIASYTDRTYTITLSVPWNYSQILTTVYMIGGYQSSALWSNVNRCAQSTQTTVNLGDGNVDNFHYKSGATSYNKTYIWNGGPTGFSLRTETKNVSGNNAGGGGNNGTMFNQRTGSYTTGEGTGTINKFIFSSETQTNLGNGWNDHAASISGQYRGIFWGNSGQSQRVYFPSDAVANLGYSVGAHGQQKGMMAKTGYGYGGQQGDYAGGNTWRKTNIESESQASSVGKIVGSCGEENYGMSQDYGFLLGEHDPSGQNNRSGWLNYSTDSTGQNGSTVEPKGHGGASSGHCGWRD